MNVVMRYIHCGTDSAASDQHITLDVANDRKSAKTGEKKFILEMSRSKRDIFFGSQMPF